MSGGNHMLKEVFQIIHNSKNWEETYIPNNREMIKLWSEAIWVSMGIYFLFCNIQKAEVTHCEVSQG